jgi:hypothetical protein
MSALLIETIGHLRDVVIARYAGEKQIPKLVQIVSHPDRRKQKAERRETEKDPAKIAAFFGLAPTKTKGKGGE